MSQGLREIYDLTFQKTPIFLNDGLAAAIPTKTLPIIAITEAANFSGNLLNGKLNLNLNDFQATFTVMPGTVLINNDIGQYPFASQEIAANAIIPQPLSISMMMSIPVKQNGGYTKKSITLAALKFALDEHNRRGGTYTVATPAWIYTGCILTGLRDASNANDRNMQNAFQFEFLQPLIESSSVEKKLGALLDAMDKGLPKSPSFTG